MQLKIIKTNNDQWVLDHGDRTNLLGIADVFTTGHPIFDKMLKQIHNLPASTYDGQYRYWFSLLPNGKRLILPLYIIRRPHDAVMSLVDVQFRLETCSRFTHETAVYY